jgi:hypothetical protein
MPPKNTGLDPQRSPDTATGTRDKNTGHGAPDMDKNTGHPCPEHRTSATGTPDTGVRLIDPLIDPGNRPGSREETEANISDVRREEPSDTRVKTDITIDADPEGVVRLGEGDEPRQGSALGGHEMSAHEGLNTQPTNGGTRPASYDPFNPSSDPTDGAALEAAVEEYFSKTQPEPDSPPKRAEAEYMSRYGSIVTRAVGLTPWPAWKPIPKPGEPGFDPFVTYFDQTTGELIGSTPGVGGLPPATPAVLSGADRRMAGGWPKHGYWAHRWH